MNKKILSLIESLSNEKSLNKEIIFDILEKSLETSIKKKENNINIKVKFDRKSGNLFFFKRFKIVNIVKDKNKEISINNLPINYINKNINDYIEFKLENFKFNRVISKSAKQIIFYKIREIEKNLLIDKYKKFIGNLFIGKIRKILSNKTILDIGYEYEAILNNSKKLFNDNINIGNKIKVILYDIKYTKYGFQFFVTRSHIYLLIKLIFNNIYEFNKNIINIKYFSRFPGIKTKIVLKVNNKNFTLNRNIFNKLSLISNELNGEKIEFIIWDNNLKKFIKNIILPIKAKLINIYKDRIDISIYKKDIYLLLGKNNINIKLIREIITNKYLNVNILN